MKNLVVVIVQNLQDVKIINLKIIKLHIFNVQLWVVIMIKKNVHLIIEVDKNNFANKYKLKNYVIKHF